MREFEKRTGSCMISFSSNSSGIIETDGNFVTFGNEWTLIDILKNWEPGKE